MFCPRRQRSLDTVECGRCRHGHGLTFSTEDRALFMDCGWPRVALDLHLDEEAVENALGTLVTKPAPCVAQDAELAHVLPDFVHGGVDAAAVVDAEGRAIGILTKSDLLRWYCGGEHASATAPIAAERPEPPRVRDAMSHLLYTLHAGADIARAAALMAYERVHQVVVTDSDARPIGIVSSLDITGCIARRNGYVLDSATRER